MSRSFFWGLGLLLVVPCLPGCDLLAALLCDQETDENCEDPERAQILGTVTLPEASGASLHLVDAAQDGSGELRVVRQRFKQRCVGLDGHAQGGFTVFNTPPALGRSSAKVRRSPPTVY